MKILITYFTVTKNTEKIATAIYDEVSSNNHVVDLKNIHEISLATLHDYDLIFLGSACHDTDVAKPVRRLLNEIPESPNFKLAGFTTHATYLPEGSQRNKELFTTWASKSIKTFQEISKEKKIDFKGYFSCMGAPSRAIANFIHETIISNEDEWEEYIEEVSKHPNVNDMQNARQFANDILSQC
jgi:flavodoxin